MTPSRAAQILREHVAIQRRHNLLSESFPAQRAFLESKCRMRVACCTRRAGKSYGLGLLAFHRAMAQPNVTVIYAALTRESAKRIMWRDVLKEIDRKYAIGAKFNEADLTVTLTNGSTIALVGADASIAEAAKLKGIKPVLCIVDECQDFRTDLEELCYRVMRPALVDNRGDLLLAGVPGNIKAFFWRVSTGGEPGWEVHGWSGEDNPHIRQQWLEEIADLVRANPRVIEAPWFRSEYKREWVVDASLRAYSGYSAANNDISEQPNVDEWTFVLACDLGWRDSTALVLMAYSPYDPTLYVLKAQKRAKLDVTSVAEWIQTWAARYPIAMYVADTASKQVVEELRNRHGIPFEAAEKREKSAAIAMLNSDILIGKVKFLQPHCAALTGELEALIWDKDHMPAKVEHPGCENHASDCLLYGWRRATNYAPVEKPKAQRGVPHTDEDMNAWIEEREAAEARVEWWEQ